AMHMPGSAPAEVLAPSAGVLLGLEWPCEDIDGLVEKRWFSSVTVVSVTREVGKRPRYLLRFQDGDEVSHSLRNIAWKYEQNQQHQQQQLQQQQLTQQQQQCSAQKDGSDVSTATSSAQLESGSPAEDEAAVPPIAASLPLGGPLFGPRPRKTEEERTADEDKKTDEERTADEDGNTDEEDERRTELADVFEKGMSLDPFQEVKRTLPRHFVSVSSRAVTISIPLAGLFSDTAGSQLQEQDVEVVVLDLAADLEDDEDAVASAGASMLRAFSSPPLLSLKLRGPAPEAAEKTVCWALSIPLKEKVHPESRSIRIRESSVDVRLPRVRSIASAVEKLPPENSGQSQQQPPQQQQQQQQPTHLSSSNPSTATPQQLPHASPRARTTTTTATHTNNNHNHNSQQPQQSSPTTSTTTTINSSSCNNKSSNNNKNNNSNNNNNYNSDDNNSSSCERAMQLRTTGNDQFKAGKYREASDSYSAALELDPGNAGLLANRAAAATALGDWTKALEDAKAAVEAESSHGRAHERCARSLLLLDRLPEGLEFCTRRVGALSVQEAKSQEWKTFVATAQRLSHAAAALRQVEVDLKDRVKAAAGDAAALQMLATLKELENEFLEARSSRASPFGRRLRLLRVQAWLLPVAGKSGQPEEVRTKWARDALEEARRLTGEGPGELLALHWQACALLRLSRRDEARECLKQALRVGQGEPLPLSEELLDSLRAADAQKAQGNDAFQRREWRSALQHFDAAVQADGRHLDAEFSSILFCNRGAVRQKLWKAQAALEDFTMALCMAPKYAKALFRRGAVYLELERYRSAEADFEAVALLEPKFVGLQEHRRRARLWARQPPKRNFYAILGIGFDVSSAELKKAYRASALKWHPDKNIDQPEKAEKRFKDIQEAFETLSDAKSRQEYLVCS
ncbi:unnamed protein product, partial [Polarella glacialis]